MDSIKIRLLLRTKKKMQTQTKKKLKIQICSLKNPRCNFSTGTRKSPLKKRIWLITTAIINQEKMKSLSCSVQFAWKIIIWRKDSLWSWNVVIHFVKNALKRFIRWMIKKFSVLLTNKPELTNHWKMSPRTFRLFICLNANKNRIKKFFQIPSAKSTILKNQCSIAPRIKRWFASSVCWRNIKTISLRAHSRFKEGESQKKKLRRPYRIITNG